MAFDYGTVKDLYDTLHDAGVVSQPLPDWATEMNRLTQSDLYSAGLHDNFIKRTSHSIDKLLESSGLPDIMGGFGRSVGEAVGAPDTGEAIGRGTPRMMVNLAPLAIPGLGWTGVAAKVLPAARLGLAGLMSGTETYTATDSPAAGVLSGATVAAFPGVVGGVERLAASRGAGRIGQFLAGQGGFAGLSQLSEFGQQAIAGQPLSVHPVDMLLNMTLGQAPFAAIHLGRNVLGLNKAAKVAELRQAKADLDTRSPIEKVPPPETADVNLDVLRETEQRLAQVRGEQVKVEDDLTLTPSDRLEKLNLLLGEEGELLRTKEQVVGTSVLGDAITPASPRETILGHQIKSTDKWRAVFVADVPENPEALRGKVVSYSTAYEPTPTKTAAGTTSFALPNGQWRTVKTLDEWTGRGRKPVDPLQPDLPQQPREPTAEEMFGHIRDLEETEADIDVAQTPAQLQQAVTKINDVKEQVGLPPTNDATLRRTASVIEKSGLVDEGDVVKVAAKVEARTASRRLRERAAPELSSSEAADITARMGGEGFSVQTTDKLSHAKSDDIESKPISDVVTDTAFAAIQSREAIQTFAEWEGRLGTTYASDAQDFVDLIERYGSLTKVPLKDAAMMLNERTGGHVWDAKGVEEFLSRPHVKVLAERLETGLKNIVSRTLPPHEKRISAGQDWVWGLRPIEMVKGLSKEGVMPVGRFRNVASERGSMSQAEFDLLKIVVPEAFKGDGVDVRKLYELLQTKGPVVEVRKLTEKVGTEQAGRNRAADLQHQLETIPGVDVQTGMVDPAETIVMYKDKELVDQDYFDPKDFNPEEHVWANKALTPEQYQLYKNWSSAMNDWIGGEYDSSGASYAAIAPKSPSEMPGYVEGLVRVPTGKKVDEGIRRGLATEDDGFGGPDAEEVAAFNREAADSGIKYAGPHFGSEDTNVLSFYRGYEETLPDGVKAFHVIEVQSDWGQQQREIAQTRREGFEHRIQAKDVDHPLLKVYESLALKAAIQHAKEVGATKVILSDAETAMMTEGHDRTFYGKTFKTEAERDAAFNELPQSLQQRVLRNNLNGPTLELSDKSPEFVSGSKQFGFGLRQENGMRLHYDQTLPSAMEKLTGERGKSVDVGVHKSTKLDAETEDGYTKQEAEARVIEMKQSDPNANIELLPQSDGSFTIHVFGLGGSPVFRDSSGNPKTQITGRLYDITKVPDKFTLTDPSRSLSGLKTYEESFVPQTDHDNEMIQKFGTTGQQLFDHVVSLKIPFINELMQDLSKFSESLKRITVRVVKTDGNAYATKNHNREVGITLNHGLIDASPELQAITGAHELVHGLLMTELDNPTKVALVKQFQELRERIIDQLPKDLRQVYDHVIDSNWHERFLNDVVGEQDMFPLGVPFDWKKADIIYSLLDNDEFASGGLTSPNFRNFLESVKAPTKERWFHRFSNLVRSVLGLGEKVKATAFEEFLSKTDQLLQRGDYVAGFHNFGERFYKNLGFSDMLAQGQTQRALGLVIDSGYGLTKSGVFDSLDIPGPVRSREFIAARRDFIKMQMDKGDDFIVHAKVMDEMGFGIDHRGTDEFTRAILSGDVSGSDALDLLPTQTLDYMFAKAKDFRDVLSSIKAATEEKNKGFVNIADVKALKPVVADALGAINKLLETQRVHEEGNRIVQELHAIEPDTYVDQFVSGIRKAPSWLGGSDKPKAEKAGWLKWFGGTAAQLSRSDPVLAEYFDRGFEINNNARDMHREITKPLGINVGDKGGNITKDGLDQSLKAIGGPKLLNALNRWMYWDNEIARREGRGVTMLPDSHPEVAKLLANLTPAERTAVTDTRAKTVIMTRQAQYKQLEKYAQTSIQRGAIIVVKDRQVKPKEALDASGKLFNAFIVDRADPAKAQEADAAIQLVQSKTTPEGFLDLVRFTQNEVAHYKLWEKYFEENPAWATAQRQERWLIEYRRGNKLVQDQGSSQKEVLEKAKGATITKQPWDQFADKNREEYVAPSLSEDAFKRLKELEDNRVNMLKSSLSPEQVAEVERLNISTQFAREQVANVGAIPNFKSPARLLSKGADELPWLWNHITWAERMSNGLTRQLFRAQADLQLANPELSQRPDLVKILKDHRDMTLSPDPSLIQEINKFTTTWYLSAIAPSLINSFQTISTLIPELTRYNGGRWMDSYSRWKDAVSLVSRNGLSRKGWGDADVTRLMKDFIKDGEGDYSMWDENAATQDTLATRWKQLISKDKVQTVGQHASSMLGSVSTAGLWLFKQPERFNRQVAVIAGFKLARENGMNYEDAKTEGYRLNRAVNYGGGKTNRPIGAFSGEGQFPRSVALLASNLQGYNIGVISQLARYLQDGFFRPTGLKPNEIYAARKAATQMLGTQLALAGILGMPFVGAMLAVLNQAFPDLEVNKNLRETMQGIFGGDKDNVLGDIALTGLPSMLGWDMQSRLSVGTPIPGVSEFNGFQPEQLLGPPMGLAYNFLNGVGKVAQGQPQGGDAFVPPGIKKLFQLVRGGGTVQDYKGRPIFEPTPGESLGLALGFQPKRLSDFNTASRIAKQSQDVSNRRLGQFHQTLAEEVLKGNFGSVRQQLLTRLQDDKNYSPLDGVRAVARSAEELTFPRDLRREGSRSTSTARSQLLSALNIPPSVPSESARLKFRSEVERRLGLPGAGANAQEAQIAYLMDEMRRQKPDATRAELRQGAEKLVRRQKLQTLLEPQE